MLDGYGGATELVLGGPQRLLEAFLVRVEGRGHQRRESTL